MRAQLVALWGVLSSVCVCKLFNLWQNAQNGNLCSVLMTLCVCARTARAAVVITAAGEQLQISPLSISLSFSFPPPHQWTLTLMVSFCLSVKPLFLYGLTHSCHYFFKVHFDKFQQPHFELVFTPIVWCTLQCPPVCNACLHARRPNTAH